MHYLEIVNTDIVMLVRDIELAEKIQRSLYNSEFVILVANAIEDLTPFSKDDLETINLFEIQLNKTELTKDEMMDLIVFGFKFQHESFSDEWVTFDLMNEHFITEDGHNMGKDTDSEFWQIRSGSTWEKGWSIVWTK